MGVQNHIEGYCFCWEHGLAHSAAAVPVDHIGYFYGQAVGVMEVRVAHYLSAMDQVEYMAEDWL